MSGSEERTQMGCSGCSVEDCPARTGREGGSLRGWGLGLAAVAVFLCPVVLAIVGAICCGASERSQLVGAIGGLVLGMVVSLALVKVFWGEKGERARSQ